MIPGELLQGLTFAAVLGAAVRVESRLTLLEAKLGALPCSSAPNECKNNAMKNRIRKFLLSLVLVGIGGTAAALLTGCGTTAAPIVRDTVVTVETNQTPSGPQIVTTTNHVYRLSETWQTGIATGQTIAPAVPGGWGAPVAALLSLVSLILGAVAKAKNDKARRADVIAGAIIQGVELANQPETKAAVAKVASAIGIGRELDNKVQEITK